MSESLQTGVSSKGTPTDSEAHGLVPRGPALGATSLLGQTKEAKKGKGATTERMVMMKRVGESKVRV